MGNKVEVWVYKHSENPNGAGPGYGKDYYYEMAWRGESLIRAFFVARRLAKKFGYGCIKIEYRP